MTDAASSYPTDGRDDVRGEVVDQTVEVEIAINAPAESVYDFLVVPEKLLRWLGQSGTIDPRPGGDFAINIGGDDVAVGQYVDLDRPKRVRFTWGWQGSDLVPPGSSTVEITLHEEDDSTLVHLAHSGLPAEQDALHLQGWLYHGGELADAVSDDA